MKGVLARAKRGLGAAYYRLVATPAPASPDDMAAEPAVAGFFAAPSGIGASARLAFDALAAAGLAPGAIDVAARFGQAEPALARERQADSGLGPLIVHANPPELPAVLSAVGAARLGRRWRVGYWVWELPRAPAAWAVARRYVHEIWTPSTFSAAALAAADPALRARVVPHPVPETRGRPDRARFGLPEGAFVALVFADPRSSLARKNPAGAIAAFARAFGADPGARLVVKLGPAAANPDAVARLRQAAPETAIFIDTALDVAGVADLIASCDALVSLHRAEGFGLTIAEAMRAGKPAIATGWSGNMDFMAPDCAIAVPYRLVPVADPAGLYAGGVWAEPDIDAAAASLRALRTEPARAADLGRKARAHTDAWFAPARWRAALSPAFLARCADEAS